MSDTPRTDAVAFTMGRINKMPDEPADDFVPGSLARALERENAALLAEKSDAITWSMFKARAEAAEAERDALRADAARWLWWRAQWCDPDSEAIGEHDIGDCADAESLDAAIDVQIAKSHPN